MGFDVEFRLDVGVGCGFGFHVDLGVDLHVDVGFVVVVGSDSYPGVGAD